MYTPTGQFIREISLHNDWIWSINCELSSKHVIIGTNDGMLSCHKMITSTVHGLYSNKYAFRNNTLTDVTVQNLEKMTKTIISNSSYIKKIANTYNSGDKKACDIDLKKQNKKKKKNDN